MAYAYAIDTTVPANTDLVREGAGVIRDFKSAVVERLESFFVDSDADPLTVKDGMTFGTMNVKTIMPITNTTYNLGDSTHRFATAYVGALNANNGVTVSSGTTAVQALTATTLSTTSTVTSTMTSGQVWLNNSVTTGNMFFKAVATAKTLLLGFESSVGASLATGTLANAVVVGNLANSPLDFVTNNNRRGGFSNAGVFDVTAATTATVAAKSTGASGREWQFNSQADGKLAFRDNTTYGEIAYFDASVPAFYPSMNNAVDLGKSGVAWKNGYFSGGLTVFAGTTAVQAFSATTGLFTSSFTLAAGGATINIDATGGFNSTVFFKNTGVLKWILGNNYSAGGNAFELNNAVLGTPAIIVAAGDNSTTFGAPITVNNTVGGASVLIQQDPNFRNIYQQWKDTASGKSWVWQMIGGSDVLVLTADVQVLQIDPANGRMTLRDDYLARRFAAMANGAGAAAGTLTNSPVAGNPTKWLAVDDNGTTRYVPAW